MTEKSRFTMPPRADHAPLRGSILFVLLCLLVASPGLAEGLAIDQLEFSGVTLIQSSAELSQRLGAPIASHSTTDRDTGEAARIEVYRGVTAYLVAGEAMKLKTTDREVSTPAGARVGDSVEKVLGLYAPLTPRVLAPDRLELRVEGSEASLVFHTYRNRVTAIELVLDYS